MKKNVLETLSDYSLLIRSMSVNPECITDCLGNVSLRTEYNNFKQACADIGWYSDPNY